MNLQTAEDIMHMELTYAPPDYHARTSPMRPPRAPLSIRSTSRRNSSESILPDPHRVNCPPAGHGLPLHPTPDESRVPVSSSRYYLTPSPTEPSASLRTSPTPLSGADGSGSSVQAPLSPLPTPENSRPGSAASFRGTPIASSPIPRLSPTPSTPSPRSSPTPSAQSTRVNSEESSRHLSHHAADPAHPPLPTLIQPQSQSQHAVRQPWTRPHHDMPRLHPQNWPATAPYSIQAVLQRATSLPSPPASSTASATPSRRRGDDTIIAPSSSRRRLLGSRSASSSSSSHHHHHHQASPYSNNNASVHPSFRSKSVCKLECRYCSQNICGRGMKAILLADTRVELYSTDTVPSGRVQLVGDDYMTRNCQCRIRDVACLICGNVVGYHVTQPCEVCMGACNNGHFWMFHDDAVAAIERMDSTGQSVLVWAHLPFADRDAELWDNHDVVCR